VSGRVTVHIEQLVVTGCSHAQGERIAASLQPELARLCAGGAGRARPLVADELRASAVNAGRRVDPELLGARLARSIHRSLGL